MFLIRLNASEQPRPDAGQSSRREGSRANGTVDRKLRFVPIKPIKTDPFHPAAVVIHGNPGQVLQEGFAVATK